MPISGATATWLGYGSRMTQIYTLKPIALISHSNKQSPFTYQWAETESIGSGRCYLTITGDWWYAHVKSNGHLIGIHFTNSTNTQPDRGAILDATLLSQ